MTGGQAAVRTLLAHGVTDLFGLPGVQNDWFYNALYDEGAVAGNDPAEPGRIRVFTARHEQGAAYMALGYALSSDRVGVLSVVPGPGLLNAAAGIATGYGLGARMVCLAGQIPSEFIDRGIGFLHEIVDQPSVVGTVTKWQGRAHRVGEVSPLVAEAFRQTQTGDRRPVLMEIPPDVLADETTSSVVGPLPITQPKPDPRAIEAAVETIGAAANPMIVVGGGAMEAAPEIRRLAERLQAPVTGHRSGRGILDARHPLWLPFTAAHRMWPEVDVVIAVGTRLQLAVQDWGTDADGPAQVWVNPDPAAAHRVSSPDVSIVARAEETIPMLLDELAYVPREGIGAAFANLRREAAEEIAVLEPQVAYLDAIRRSLGEHGVLVSDLTQVAYASRVAYDVYAPKTYLFPGYPGTLGWAFPTALGAKVANPDRRVVCLAGDGGFLYTANELATAVAYGIDTITVVFEDGRFGNVQLMQREFYDGRVHATDFANPDFVAYAESFGANGRRVGSPDELADAIDAAAGTAGPSVIVVPQGDWPNPWSILRTGRVRGGRAD